MKRRLLLGMLLLAGLGMKAQLAPGTQAPDFTATDINGNSHTLSQYLAQGKTVIIDVSATWCGPCWNYHGTHALADMYEAYGPEGSDEVVVLFVEGDPGTSVQSLYGTNIAGDNGTTQGNWTVNSPYPIIDSGEIASLYEIAYFPTVYRICPDGKVTEMTQPSAAQLKTAINTNCGGLDGIQNHVKVEGGAVRVCQSGDSSNVQATLKNFGVNPLTSAQLVVKENGTTIATKDYTGNLAQFAAPATVSFENVAFTPGNWYTVEAINVNSSTPNGSLNAKQFDVYSAAGGINKVEARIYTDNYPSEISWSIKDSSGEIVAEGGPYQAGPGSAGAGGPDANTTKVVNFELPAGEMECLTVELKDSYGDGWSLGNARKGIELFSDGLISVYKDDAAGNFGTSKITKSAYRTNGSLNTNSVNATTFSVYPNPTTGILNFNTQETIDVTIVDITGKTVFTQKSIKNNQSVNLGNLQKGMYIAKIKGATAEKVEKIILN